MTTQHVHEAGATMSAGQASGAGELIERLEARCLDRRSSRGNDGTWYFPVSNEEWAAIRAATPTPDSERAGGRQQEQVEAVASYMAHRMNCTKMAFRPGVHKAECTCGRDAALASLVQLNPEAGAVEALSASLRWAMSFLLPPGPLHTAEYADGHARALAALAQPTGEPS